MEIANMSLNIVDTEDLDDNPVRRKPNKRRISEESDLDD